jgi:D-alanyl-D-alanine dipeptidase
LALAVGVSCGDDRPSRTASPRPAGSARPPASPSASSPDATDAAEPTDAAGQDALRDPPPGFVDLKDAVPGIRLDIRYATANNFTGAVLPGYAVAGAWLRTDAAKSLALVQADLAREGLGLLVHDAYRPARASEAMVTWARQSRRGDLLEDGYVARRSNHNRGTTVDLTLVDHAAAIAAENVIGAIEERPVETGLTKLILNAGWRNFREPWARDFGFASFGLLEIHEYRVVKETLELFLHFQRPNGQFPVKVHSTNVLESG